MSKILKMDYSTWLYFIVFLCGTFLTWSYYYGIFNRMQIHTITLPQCELMYFCVRGEYSQKLPDQFKKIHNLIRENKSAHKVFNRQGKLMFGMYYDNPEKVKDVNKMRAVVGFLFTPKDQTERDLIIEHLGRLGMKYAKIAKTKALFTRFEVKVPAIVSYMVAPAQFYNQVEKYIRRRKPLREMVAKCETANQCGFEIYTDSYLYFHKPLENFDQFDLTEHGPPALKRVKGQKLSKYKNL